MQTIGLVLNLTKGRVPQVAREIVAWLERRGIHTLFTRSDSLAVDLPARGAEEEDLIRQADCFLALGGDGTLLAAARFALAGNKPLMGINLGQLGFLTEIELPDLYRGLEKLLAGEYTLEARMTLRGELRRAGKVAGEFLALNDIVVTRGAFSRLIELRTYVEEDFVATYPADGLIVATPTGSTAYSLAAGGPIVVPSLEVVLLTPICPHTFYARPLVIEAEKQVRVVIESDMAEVMLTVDGQRGYPLKPRDEIRVTKGATSLRLIRLAGRSFFEVMRQKLHLGEGKGSGGPWRS